MVHFFLGNSTPSKEHAALKALRDFATLEDGYHLVPEHIESRTLYRPDKPGISQVRLSVLPCQILFPHMHLPTTILLFGSSLFYIGHS